MLNVTIIGRLTKDPEVKTSQTGNQYASFTIAVNIGKDAQGEEKAAFINCSAYGKTGQLIAEKMQKGKRIAVVGNLTDLGAYSDNNGNPRASTHCAVNSANIIDWPEQAQPSAPPQQYQQPQYQQAPQQIQQPQQQTQLWGQPQPQQSFAPPPQSQPQQYQQAPTAQPPKSPWNA